jgi:hypothetical protein
MKTKDVSKIAKEVADIYEKETMYPSWLAYPFWWLVIFIKTRGGKTYDIANKTEENR